MTQQELKELLHYDQDTGIFTWLVPRANNAVKIGTIAGGKSPKGYWRIKIYDKPYQAHRLAWLYVYSEFPKEYIDHINGSRSDNRICNLREATYQQNAFNQKMSSRNTSGVKGVHWSKADSAWIIKINGKLVGYSKDFFESCCISFSFRKKIHGEFANHG
jgi:hypothetical protein